MNFLRNASCVCGLNILSYHIAASGTVSSVSPPTDSQADGKAKNYFPYCRKVLYLQYIIIDSAKVLSDEYPGLCIWSTRGY